jgi:hypothetical protein
MPAKKTQHDPLKNPNIVVDGEEMDSFPQPVPGPKIHPAKYAIVDNKIIVELVKFGQLILARCEDDTMYFMQTNGTWAQFMFEVITERG